MAELDKIELARHKQWLGYLQPQGLVVTPASLLAAQAVLSAQVADFQDKLQEFKYILDTDTKEEIHGLTQVDTPAFVRELLGWPSDWYVVFNEANPSPPELEVFLKEYGETLRPDIAVKEPEPTKTGSPWQMLVQYVKPGIGLDEVWAPSERQWQASPQIRMERLLRETKVPVGLLINGPQIRLVFAPRGESSGHLTFPISAMLDVQGRPILAGFHLLLNSQRLFTHEASQRLVGILTATRQFQARVSETLSDQILEGLYELVRGFQAANDKSDGVLLREQVAEEHGRQQVYSGLLTTLLRLIFTLYAEDRELLSKDAVFTRNYSLSGLFERLREDGARFPESMNDRFGAWAQLLTLFRLIYDGGHHAGLNLPARHGYLFDPDRYPFLEGRAPGSRWKGNKTIKPPKVSDGVVLRVLEKLLLLDGERLSYRSLDVEHIGSVYEKMMGFNLIECQGETIALKGEEAPVAIDLEALLATKPADRERWLKDQVKANIDAGELKAAKTTKALLEVLDKRIDRRATPEVLPKGTLLLQPNEERRKSGSHYTPRQLTAPIVEKALEPILKQLGVNPKPAQLLDLKVCDPAMGSGAFLVEVCRQLSEHLVQAWRAAGEKQELPSDEDELLYARRLVAQRCLYGVDRNPMAVDLAKMSLWLSTLAKDHAFTFLDHNLRHGDALVGMTIDQIRDFNWEPKDRLRYIESLVTERLIDVAKGRKEIEEAGDSLDHDQLHTMHLIQERMQADLRLIGDLLVLAFFSSGKPKDQETKRLSYLIKVRGWLEHSHGRAELVTEVQKARQANPPLVPFHWEIEFPEVFLGDHLGFDCFVGNPPFAGKNTIIAGNLDQYLAWLQTLHPESHGNADLVAHFYRRAFNLLRAHGTFGLIATNTISQGDTRSSGLRWICKNDGSIYAATRRVKWPGLAAVVVSVVWVRKGGETGPVLLDGKQTGRISAFLVSGNMDDNPAVLAENEGKSFQGSILLGMGFTFDDEDRKGVASSISEMKRLIKQDPRNQERIYPYVGGEEVNKHPQHAAHRFAIDFGALDENHAKKWPDLYGIVKARVKPERDGQKRDANRDRWWQYAEKRPGLYKAIKDLERVLVVNCGASPHMAFTFLPSRMVFANTLAVFAYDRFAEFAILQSRVHEVWARFFSSSMKDDLRYTPSSCAETFPLPSLNSDLEKCGKDYFEARAETMKRTGMGMTDTYNLFHDRAAQNRDIDKLRALHLEMDSAVLRAYGWDDLEIKCDFFLDYEEEEVADGRKKPWRYRWPDELRDEVLGRLLLLNKKRTALNDDGKIANEIQKAKAPELF